MTKLVKLVNEYLSDSCPDTFYNKYFSENHEIPSYLKHVLFRLNRDYMKRHISETQTIDFACSFFQLLSRVEDEIQIPSDIWEELSSFERHFGFIATKYDDHVNVQLSRIVKDSMLNGVIRKVFMNCISRNFNRSIGSPGLYKNFNYHYYKSYSQKICVEIPHYVSDGTTTLIVLPTGEGKSLVGLINGILYNNNLSIIVVPTIALAIDQARASNDFFGNNHHIMAYYSGLCQQEVTLIKERIQNKTLRLLYISPEALLNGFFHDMIIELAGEGKVSNLIIDECHLVVEWGALFRPEFQFLAAFQNELYRLTKGKLKTILLSATITAADTKILKRLFSINELFVEVRCDYLRPEINYFVKKVQNFREKQNYFEPLLYILPKPMIIYVQSPDDAKNWLDWVRAKGYEKAEMFTGDTENSDRERLVKQWNDNVFDIMIATSAFGMGVDKSDVKTVVHLYVPPSINQFYQEVGRSGRDGCSSLSYWIYSAEDLDRACDLVNKSVLTEEKILSRWDALLIKAIESRGSYIELDMHTKDKSLWDKITGDLNVKWNEYIVLLFHRYGLIELIRYSKSKQNKEKTIGVNVIDHRLINDEKYKVQRIVEIREIEKKYRMSAYNQIKEYLDHFEERCIGEVLSDNYLYPDSDCTGCMGCRVNYGFTVQIHSGIKNEHSLYKQLENNMNNSCKNQKNECLYYYDNYANDQSSIQSLIDQLCAQNSESALIIPSMSYEFIELIDALRDLTLFVISPDEINRITTILRPNLIALLPDEEDLANQIYTSIKVLDCVQSCTFISPRTLWLKSENKKIDEVVNGSIKHVKASVWRYYERDSS